jgi:DNA-directed RNA polymerase, subunit RPC10 (contains C4-type Zn-finger)
MSNLLEYKCPCCGGSIAFDSASQQMVCPFCDTQFELETLKSYDDELKNEQPSEMEWDVQTSGNWADGELEGMSVYGCNSCGGEIVAEQVTGAMSCPYCGNPIVMKGQFAGSLRPDWVIPFKLDKKAATAALKKHVNSKRFVPAIFKSQNHIDEIKGIYVPFWLFDTDVDASVRYKATKLRRWSDAKYNYVETSHFHVVREGNIGFDCVPVDGSSKLDDTLMESIEPYNFKEAVDFQTAYLSGFLADKYDVDAEQSIGKANTRVKHSTESAFAATVTGFNSVTVGSSDIRLSNGKVRYALLPVWLLNTSWNKEKYTFAMNAQTGKFVGNLPMDKKEYWKWFGILTAIFGAVAFGIQWLLLFL